MNSELTDKLRQSGFPWLSEVADYIEDLEKKLEVAKDALEFCATPTDGKEISAQGRRMIAMQALAKISKGQE